MLAPPTQARLSGDRSLLARFTRKGIWGEVKDARESQVSKIALDAPPQLLENEPFLFQSLFSSLPFCEPPADKSQPGLAGGRGGEPPTIGRMIRNPATFLVLANAPLQPFGRKEVTKENKINLRKFKRHSTKKARPSHCSVRRTESGGLPSSFPINLRL